jgi:hypothetical protein
MNIFYLHENPEVAASFHCDKHCVKMILESAQLLSTAHRELDGSEYADSVSLYKSFSPNHPSALWVRESCDNYRWLWKLMFELCLEYNKRYEKHHAIVRKGLLSALSPSPTNMEYKGFTSPPPCMPDQYKVEGDTVQSYQNYYHGEKAYFAKWRLGEPDWWKGEV